MQKGAEKDVCKMIGTLHVEPLTLERLWSIEDSKRSPMWLKLTPMGRGEEHGAGKWGPSNSYQIFKVGLEIWNPYVERKVTEEF